MRIGVVRHFWKEDLTAATDVCAAMDAALDVLSELGARLETIRVDPLQQYYDVKNVIAKSEVFAVHQRRLIERLEDFGAEHSVRIADDAEAHVSLPSVAQWSAARRIDRGCAGR